MSNKLTDQDILSLGITAAWANFIIFAKNQCPHGHIDVKIANGEPKQMLNWERDIRFDKAETIPSGGRTDLENSG